MLLPVGLLTIEPTIVHEFLSQGLILKGFPHYVVEFSPTRLVRSPG